MDLRLLQPGDAPDRRIGGLNRPRRKTRQAGARPVRPTPPPGGQADDDLDPLVLVGIGIKYGVPLMPVGAGTEGVPGVGVALSINLSLDVARTTS